MTQTCRNCLNAYNSPYQSHPLCVNKEWLSQFQPTDCTVRTDETCGTWHRRNDSQPPVRFAQPVQLKLFD